MIRRLRGKAVRKKLQCRRRGVELDRSEGSEGLVEDVDGAAEQLVLAGCNEAAAQLVDQSNQLQGMVQYLSDMIAVATNC